LHRFSLPSCLTTPPIIGVDGIETAFGDSATGVVDGPGPFDIDLSILRTVPISWPKECSRLEFRADFFNALNHRQFSNPNTNFGSFSFGISS
jgi:hypothetical protein